jgi:hypothetical protein
MDAIFGDDVVHDTRKDITNVGYLRREWRKYKSAEVGVKGPQSLQSVILRERH